MNIKQAEQLSGVSRQNIRFYEREGLLHPSRNPQNDYREYYQEDIRTLKLIRAMRMLDMPLDQIKALLEGDMGISDAVEAQQIRLQDQVRQLTAAIRFCNELKETRNLMDLDVDELLCRMEAPETQKRLSQSWLDDYRKVRLAEREKVFTFIPDGAVTNAREFTDALVEYANEKKLNLVITKESMYPEFTIDGVEYRAERLYSSVQGIPVASIRCEVKHPEDFEPDVPPGRKRLMKLLNFGWILVPFLLINLGILIRVGWGELLSNWEGWLFLLSVLAIAFSGLYRFWLYHFNENGK